MNYSNSMKALPILSQNFITNITPISSNLFNINNTNFQPINSFIYKNSSPNKNILGLLTERNYDYKMSPRYLRFFQINLILQSHHIIISLNILQQ